jgi:hypothetical protein
MKTSVCLGADLVSLLAVMGQFSAHISSSRLSIAKKKIHELSG